MYSDIEISQKTNQLKLQILHISWGYLVMI